MPDKVMAANYQENLEAMLERTRFYSGRGWTLNEGEHDPGRTTLELLANALAYLKAAWEEAARSPELFSREEAPGRWAPLPGSPDRLRFQANYNAPDAAVFQTRPVSGPELARDLVQKLGLKRAWTLTDDRGRTEALAEFPPLIKRGGLSEAFTPPEFPAPPDPAEKSWKEERLVLANRRLGRLQGLGQPRLCARELRCAPLTAHLTIALPEPPDEKFPSFLAALMAGTAEWLRPPAAPLRKADSGGFQRMLRKISERVAGAALSEAGRPPAESINLEPDCDAFRVTEWRATLDWGAGRRSLEAAEILAAAHLADRDAVKSLPAARHKAPPHWSDENSINAASPEKGLLHQQYPVLYQLEAEPGSKNWIGAAAQFHGWLLLFDQILGDAGRPLSRPGAYFRPRPLAMTDLWADLNHPYIETLAGGEAWRLGLEKLARLERGKIPEKLLLHLSALLGEEVWWPREWFDGRENFVEWLAAWLRELPRLNGRRLAHAHGRPGQLDEGGAALEERLAWLIGPLTAHPASRPQELFDMRGETNRVTGRREYRCFIRESAPYNDETPVRLVCDLMSPTPFAAEASALAALAQAASPDFYHLRGSFVRVGSLASLPDSGEGLPNISETVAWARTLAPPWVRALDYVELGEARPFEIAVLLTDDVPERFRAQARELVEAQLPAHLLAGIYFVGPELRSRVDSLMHEPAEVGHDSWARRYEELLEILRELEQNRA